MERELPKGYIPQEVEKNIYQKWEESGYFSPDNLPGERGEGFSVMFPPPNVTGVLHLGHAMENTIMDIVIRYQRMRGKKALLVPGTDHAAVATQARVEKNLVESGAYANPREELGREKLLEKIRLYADESKSTILSQIRMMGTSCDWSRLAYTFDEIRSQAVNSVFKKMYDDGLIYRGERIINWDPALQSTVSDDEIERVEKTEPFYYFQYGPFVIATSRPETKFGDKYVVMHPNDERYKKYNHGDTFECEWINGKIAATVIKDEAIDMELGTGVMTITPWHDQTDFEIAERHNLDKEQIIDWEGNLLSIAGEFEGIPILKARPKIVDKLKKKGLLVKIDEQYIHVVAMGDRSKELLEPQIKAQWFVDVNKKIPGRGKSLKDLMRDAVTAGHDNDPSQKVMIQPEHFTKVYLHWIDNLHDWCISRQIWWGHRIPAYYRKQENDQFPISNFQNAEKKDSNIYVGLEPPQDGEWEQDPDTLDTWFSSGMWTFSTLGWSSFVKASEDKISQTGDLETYHPSSWMQMGHEILFLWMARMILMTTYVLNEIPFKEVYIHGMLRDKNGRKFSKSLDNGIDPIEVIEKYGTDALRMSLVAGIAPGNDSRFSEEKVEHYRKFINKVWNVSRFIMMRFNENPSLDSRRQLSSPFGKKGERSIADKWIMSRLHSVTRDVSEHIDNYRFSQAAEAVYEFTWHELADWYLEISKSEEEKAPMLVYILVHNLKLLHPFAPFVTEHIWSLLPHTTNLLMIQEWPKVDGSKIDESIEKDFAIFKEVATKIRNYKSNNSIKMKEEIELHESVITDLNGELKTLTQRLIYVTFTQNGTAL